MCETRSALTDDTRYQGSANEADGEADAARAAIEDTEKVRGDFVAFPRGSQHSGREVIAGITCLPSSGNQTGTYSTGSQPSAQIDR